MSLAWREVIDKAQQEDELWSVFHENSKTSRYEPLLSNEKVLARMSEMWDSLPYEGYPVTPLPTEFAPLQESLSAALMDRVSARTLVPQKIGVQQLATLLHCAYGVTRQNEDGAFPRPFRTIPSGGALYPLEIYIHTSSIEGLTPALYHYNAREHCLRLLEPGDSSRKLAETLVQSNFAFEASVLVFVTAFFKRSVFKYGNRGYRFVLLEAGHLSQNLNLAATGLGLASVNIGGFFDRDIDSFLGLDGINHSTVYVTAIGGRPNK